jgi:4-coumarate--CoA ligase
LPNTTLAASKTPLWSDPAIQGIIKWRFRFQINQGWGMTEVTCARLMIPGGIDDDTGSVGVIIPNCEAKLLNEQNRVGGMGEKGGETLLAGSKCMSRVLEQRRRNEKMS